MKYYLQRKKLLNFVREIDKNSLVVGTWGNFSIRVEKDKFLLTPSGMKYSNLQISDFVLMDTNNKILDGDKKPSIEYHLHSYIYKIRNDINSIAHTHSDYAKIFSIARKPIPPVAEDLVQIVGGGVNISNYVLPGTEDLAKEAVNALKDKMAVLLANHGLVCVGRDIDEALKVALVVEKNAKSIILSYLIGGPVALSNEDVEIMRDFYLNKYGQK